MGTALKETRSCRMRVNNLTSRIRPKRNLGRAVGLLITCLLTACGGGGGGGSASPPVQVAPGPTTTPPVTTSTEPTSSTTTTIEVLALITPGVEAQFVDADLRIQHLFNTTNDIARTSEVDVEFVMSHLEVVSYPDGIGTTDALDDLTFATHASLSHIPALRDSHAADLVVLFRPYVNDGHCGYAWVGGYQQNGDFSHPAEADYGYAVVAANCSDYTLMHELGHNLGLAHSRREDPSGGTFSYALGHGEDNDFVTVMATPTEFNATQLPFLSSPDLSCNASPCGIAHDQTFGADAVRAVNHTAPQVAQYR